jgi:DNA-binding transcriptional ArsR family regulator
METGVTFAADIDETLRWMLRGVEAVKQRPIPDDLLALMAEKFQMLSDPTRLAILRSLMHTGEKTVSQVVAATGQSVANVSRHLKLLALGGMLARRKEGSFVKYRLDDPVVERICELVCDSLRRDLEAQLRKAKRALRQGT